MSTQKHEDWLHFVKHFHFICKELWVLLTAIIGGRADYRGGVAGVVMCLVFSTKCRLLGRFTKRM